RLPPAPSGSTTPSSRHITPHRQLSECTSTTELSTHATPHVGTYAGSRALVDYPPAGSATSSRSSTSSGSPIAGWRTIRSGCSNVSASPPHCSASLEPCCSTNLSTASTSRASAGYANCCAASPIPGPVSWLPRTCSMRSNATPTTSSSSETSAF